MLKLKANQVCPYSNKCPYADGPNGVCYGTRSDRDITFMCNFIDDHGNIHENRFRNPLDKTGNQKIIMG